ncbi:FERM, ARHGEF and pleckstrin domain-containing protein 2-like [Melitaea cinxia]|uniref:FERM, ARHGEF and pleckstrin domain-containing protein 2-like n=1 Tax=Melitaea cinxia TaxID=113334 RepID=UPI001E274076|nr:FERM, ARHGEF and pleckstrin domain-containing protein 2-like [Melitaea cinxia]
MNNVIALNNFDVTSQEDPTVSSASLCMSPNDTTDTTDAPVCTSTPFERRVTNGYRHETLDNRRDCDTVNGNVHVNIVSASTNNMDVLSGGESDAGDTLSRRNNNSIPSGVAVAGDTGKRRGDITYYVAKELLMTERTYKRDLELVTVTWSKRVGSLCRSAAGGAEAAALARACLALEPLALPAGALLARLDRALASEPAAHEEVDLETLLALPAGPFLAYLDRIVSCIDLPIKNNEEPEYKKVAELLSDYLTNTSDAYKSYTEQAAGAVALVESARRRGGEGARHAAAFERAAPLPLACLLLRPLHRLQHYERLAHELWSATGSKMARAALECARSLAEAANEQLRHVENHAALCQLQRDLVGYDKLLVADREFIRLGCVYTHTSKGLQQRMLFLFNDILILASKCSSGQFRAQAVLPLQQLTIENADLPHSFVIKVTDESRLTLSSSESEYAGWSAAVEDAIARARDRPAPTPGDLQLSNALPDYEESEGAGAGAGSALAHVCWHRAASLRRAQLHRAMRSQLSGYLLRKFKNSHGWQKLWVVFAMFTLFFYKTCRDNSPLASLPLLGYNVGAPVPSDGIDKEFVFKLQFKNHVYFFRADSHFTYSRWIEVLKTPMASDSN